MKHAEFAIGQTFWCGGQAWRCTDIGTRTIAAIRLDRDDDPSWHNGPPYAVAETLFDEDDQGGCALELVAAQDASGATLAETIRDRFAPFGGVDLDLPARRQLSTFDQIMAETIEEARHHSTTPPPPALPRWTQIDRASLPEHVQELLQDALWAGCTPALVVQAFLQGTRSVLANESLLAPEIDRLLAQIGAAHGE